MAIGEYRTATQAYRPTHVGSGGATTRSAQAPDIAGMFGDAFKTTIQAGLRYYKGLQDVGAAMQGAGQKILGWESDKAASRMMNAYGGSGGLL